MGCRNRGIAVESLLMFLLIFIWTPPHFWALALFTNDDYSRAGVPMMTVARGEIATRQQILWYALALAPVCFLIAFSGIGGPVFLVASLALNAMFIGGAVRVFNRRDADSKADKWLRKSDTFFFRLSIFSCFLRRSRWMRYWPAWLTSCNSGRGGFDHGNTA